MKDFGQEDIRNVGIVAHGGVGKTSLVEAMLFSAGVTSRLGKVEDGTTVSDYNEDEIERKISIGTSMLQFEWNGVKYNMLDTPGYTDFLGEVKSALRVCDAAVVLVHAVAGIEVGTELTWGFADDYGISRIIVINMLDKENADFDRVLAQARDRFGQTVIPLQYPVNAGPGFNQVVDLATMELRTYSGGARKDVAKEPIPDAQKDRAEELRKALVEAVAESDDELLEKYFDEGALTDEEVRGGLRGAVVAGDIYPVLCSAATENIGAQELLRALTDYAPSPSDRPQPVATPHSGAEEDAKPIPPDAPPSAIIFKTVSEAHVGELSLFRTHSGSLRAGADFLNSSRRTTERLGQIYQLKGKERREVGEVGAGDLGAVVKLKATHTGDTLCDPKHVIQYPRIEFPEPLIEVAIRPKTKGDEDKIANAIAILKEEDPSYVVDVDAELGQTVLNGQGELHLKILIDRLKNRFGVEVEQFEPRIPYRETIRGKSEAQGKYKKQSGGRGQYGDTWVRVEPLRRGEGFEFVKAVVGGVIPTKFIPSVEKGIREAVKAGILAGYPVEDLKATLYDGTHHAVDSSDVAFKVAGAMGFKKAFMSAQPVLLEPVFDVEVKVPEEFMGDVMGDISGRRGKISGVDTDGHFQVIRAQVPLAEQYRYATTLRSITGGRGIHSRKFSHYQEVPKEIEGKIIKDAEAAKEARARA